MRGWIAAFLAVLAAYAAYVRLAPHDPARWHVAVGPGPAEEVAAGGYTLRRPAQTGDLAALDRIALATPRTFRLAGSPEAGRITWVTRSRVFGFPDYTTAELADGELRVTARLRFGLGDSGVNRARVRRWLAALDAGITPEDG